MKSFKTIFNEGLIKVPPNIYKSFESALLGFAFSHMVVEVDEEGISGVKRVAKKYGVRRFPKPKNKASLSIKNPDRDIPYIDHDIDPSDKISLFLIFDERDAVHNADYDFNYKGNPAITVYVSNYVREIREAYDEDEAEFMAEQIVIRLIADLKHELMHYVQDVFLANKDEKQNQQGKLSGNSVMTSQDEIEYFTSQQEFDPTIRSEIGEFLATRSFQPSLKKHIDDSKFFQILKKHKRKKYIIAVKKFTAGINRYLESKKS